MRLKDATNTIIFEDKRRCLFLILYGLFFGRLTLSLLCAQKTKQLLCAFTFLRLYFRKLPSSLIIFLSISMRVILPISLLLSAVVALTVSRSLPSPRCLLSHYVPALLLSFVETPACICTGIRLFTFTHFSHFIPLSPLAHPLVNMIFLNSYPLAPQLLLYTAISLIPSSFIPPSHPAPLLPLLFSLQPYSFPPFSPLFHVNLVLTLSFLFPAFLFGVHLPPPFLFYPFIASSPRPILHYYFLASFFHFVSSRTVFIVPSQLPQSPRYTPQLARRDGFSFSACHTCIRRAQGLNGLSQVYRERFKHSD